MSKTAKKTTPAKVKMTERVINGKLVEVAELNRKRKFAEFVRTYWEARAAAKAADAKVKEMGARIKAFLQEHGVERAVADGMLVTAAPTPVKRLDTKRLRDDHPDLAEQYTVESQEVRLRVVPDPGK